MMKKDKVSMKKDVACMGDSTKTIYIFIVGHI